MHWLRVVTAAALLVGVELVGALVLVAVAPAPVSIVMVAIGLVAGPLAVGLALLMVRRPDAAVVAVLLAWVGVATVTTATLEAGWRYLAEHPATADSLSWLVAGMTESPAWLLVSVALLLLHFPDGRLPGPRWRWVPPVLFVAAAVNHAYGAFDQTPFRPPLESLERPFGQAPWLVELLAAVAFPTLLLLCLASAASLAQRYRRSDTRCRAQLKWLALGGIGLMAYPLVCLTEIVVTGGPSWPSAALAVTSVIGIPLSVAVATLRHDLYDVDKAFAGAVTWGLLTVALVALYAAVSTVAGAVVSGGSVIAASAAAALCALALAPLRRRLRRLVDARVYPLRRAAFSAISSLQHDAAAGRVEPEILEEVLRGALRDPGLRVGLVLPGESDAFVDANGRPVEGPEEGQRGVPVQLGGIRIGVLVPGPSGPSTNLLREVGARASTIVEVTRLRLQLAQSLREIEASRARLVQVGYQERRRLEQDLHDGAQQRLVSLGMAIRLAQRHLDDGTVDLHGLLDQCVAELGTAVAELRQLAHGIRPSSLDDGLPAAISRLVRAVPVAVDIAVDDSALPDDVATTAYFVISEALTNAVKHAGANRIGLEVSRLNGDVVVRVTDDGRGGATVPGESGLADRVAALGGTLRIASPAGRGTEVVAELPCVS
jgi:signal transduction histidine kinase